MLRILNLIFKFQIACLFVLVLATQFQFYKCGLSAVYGGNVVNDGYSEVPLTNAVPVAYPVAQARDKLGQASFGYAHPGQAATNLRDGFGNQIGSYAYINQKARKSVSPTPPTPVASASSPMTCPSLPFPIIW